MKLSSWFAVVCLVSLLISRTAYADLSVTTQWRIEQATYRCAQSNNAVKYSEYWQDAVSAENKETICMAEQFADLALLDGDDWLENKAAAYIKECRTKSKDDETAYFTCLGKGVDSVVAALATPCRELGAAQLWDENMCQQLIGFIFVKKFEGVLEANQPLFKRFLSILDKFNEVKSMRVIFNPAAALVILFLYFLDVVILVEPGNWMKITKMGLGIGLAILISSFAAGGLRTLISGIAVLVLIAAIIWNHVKPKFISAKGKKS